MHTPDQVRSMYRSMGEKATTAAGGLLCMFSVTDRTAFDAVVVGDYTLRYLSADATLERDDTIEIDGAQYLVADEPMQINALERMVGLRRDD